MRRRPPSTATSRWARSATLAVVAALCALPALHSAASSHGGVDGATADLIEEALPSVVSILVPNDDWTIALSQGSGVVVHEDGLIVTNEHVVEDRFDVVVIFHDGTLREGVVSAVDPYTDIAFVEVEGARLPALPLGDASRLRLGDLVIAVGNPLSVGLSASHGIVSGFNRTLDFDDGSSTRHLIQTDAALNPGNSGGALISGSGELVGIPTLVKTSGDGSREGLGFALPTDLIVPLIEQIVADEPLARPRLGLYFEELDPQVAFDNGLPATEGAWIKPSESGEASPVVKGGPADTAGVLPGDIITAVDGNVIDRRNPLDLELLRHKPGATVELDVLRDEERLALTAVLGEAAQ